MHTKVFAAFQQFKKSNYYIYNSKISNYCIPQINSLRIQIIAFSNFYFISVSNKFKHGISKTSLHFFFFFILISFYAEWFSKWNTKHEEGKCILLDNIFQKKKSICKQLLRWLIQHFSTEIRVFDYNYNRKFIFNCVISEISAEG